MVKGILVKDYQKLITDENFFERTQKVILLLNKMELSKKYKSTLYEDKNKENFSFTKSRNRNNEYSYYKNYFHFVAPQWLKDHRKYFNEDKRGFGEDAFHAMWFIIFRDYKPESALEIGIYRGQVISLWSMLSYNFGLKTEIAGISPFSSIGDKVSVYPDTIDYYNDVLYNLRYFQLKMPLLYKGFSTDSDMINVIKSKKWDVIYIDGNHDYEVVKNDFEVCSTSLNSGGLIVLDDSSLYTDYKPGPSSTAGHPGPSKLANEISSLDFDEIIAVGHNRVFQKRDLIKGLR